MYTCVCARACVCVCTSLKAYLEDYVNKATEIKIEIARTFIIRMIGTCVGLILHREGGRGIDGGTKCLASVLLRSHSTIQC